MGRIAMSWRRWLCPLVLWLAVLLAGCGEAIQAQPPGVDAPDLVRRAREQFDAKQYSEAEQAAGRALELAPGNPRAHYVRGLARVAREDYAKGRDDLELALKGDPDLSFTEGRAGEFEKALATAREHTMTMLGAGGPALDLAPGDDEPAADDTKGKADEPAADDDDPAAEAQPAADKSVPEEPAKPAKTDKADIVNILRSLGATITDQSGKTPPLLGAPQIKVLEQAAQKVALQGVDLKLAVVPDVADLAGEAERIHAAGGFDSQALIVLATPDGELAAYHPALSAQEVADTVAAVRADQPDASLARHLVTLVERLAPKVKAIVPAVPPAPVEEPQVAATPTPVEPTPAPWRTALPWVLGVLAAGAIGGLVWRAVTRAAAGRRLAQGFGLAVPGLQQTVASLAALAGELRHKRDRGAEVAQQAAELAYFDALTMMAEAQQGEVADTARVERAVRLLDEARAKVDEARARLTEAPARAGAQPATCFFTARPLADSREADQIELVRGDQRLVVLASREVGETLRHGQVPDVRVVGGQHWLLAPGFEPDTDFYSDRHGRKFVPATSLTWAFSGNEPCFIEPRGRPDYRLELPA